ncbi:MAG: flagellar motor protein MotB [Candidatus Cloacimonetes bacterium]|nr:flagellar motor protein MotB [Candidatus Cloacimonadota bacterium]
MRKLRVNAFKLLQKRVESLEDENVENENLLDVMVPYADLMTLLLVFFVFFFIISKTETDGATTEMDTSLELNEQVITIPSEILFEIGQANLKWAAINALSGVALEIKTKIGNESGWQIRVEGHTDNIPIHTKKFESNWDLSVARALAVVKFFMKRKYFPADQLQAMGYGEFKPIAPNDSKSNRALNRRVEIRLSKKGIEEE